MAGISADDDACRENQNNHFVPLVGCGAFRVTIVTGAIAVPAAPKSLKTNGKNFRDGLTYG